MPAYGEVRDALRSGDLVALTDKGTLFGWLIRWATHGRYAHVGIVWRIGGRIFMLEDRALTGVCIRSLSLVGPFDWIATATDWTDAVETAALDRLQRPYSWFDAIRLGLGLRPSKNGEVCSLFVADVLGLPRDAATPEWVVAHFTAAGCSLLTVTPDPQAPPSPRTGAF